ncbi:hypothetical protein [Spirosoma rhododendri]|uniref:Uncharacterized protein n=1 Tax=Spirosoma rhododendri TaxID=2728024 RepID=A0A7L5DPY0_9BACT|nr:hypothetical protein [Spirosoma rhododendri]QJD79531.1 hypothetical protein HH216_14765 [Spirosoma rhododendri]
MISHSNIKTFGTPPANPATPADAYVITTPHVCNTGKNFTQVYCTPDTSELEGGMNGEIDGRSFKVTFKFFYPGSKKELFAFKNRVKNDKFVLEVPLSDGTIIQIGSAKFPAYIAPSFKSEKMSGRGKGAEFEVTCWMPDMLIYSAAIPLTPAV